MDLTPHFSWWEVTRSKTAARLNINNSVPHELQPNVVYTAERMEELRVLLGSRPLVINSWYRCPALNKAIGGSPTSAHMRGLAVDLEPPGMTLVQAFERIGTSDIPYDQLIEERTQDGHYWIHVGFAQGTPPRRQVLRARGAALGGPMSYTRTALG